MATTEVKGKFPCQGKDNCSTPLTFKTSIASIIYMNE